MVFFLLTNRRIWCKISNIILNRVRSVCWEEKEYEKCEKMVSCCYGCRDDRIDGSRLWLKK